MTANVNRTGLLINPGYPVGEIIDEQSRTALGDNNFTKGVTLMRSLGTFWSIYFNDRATLETLLDLSLIHI